MTALAACRVQHDDGQGGWTDGPPVTKCTTSRGRKTKTGAIEPGVASWTVEAGSIGDELGTTIRVQAQATDLAWHTQFTGYVTQQRLVEAGHGAVVWMVYTARDESARLGGGIEALLEPTGGGELPGTRVARILDAAGVAPGDRLIGPGRTPMSATDLGSDLKRECDYCATAEFGAFFVSKDGTYIFFDSTQLHEPPTPYTLTLDDTTGHRYKSYIAGWDISRVRNRISAQGASGYTAKREDANSQAQYGWLPERFPIKSDDAPSIDWLADNAIVNMADAAYQVANIQATSRRGDIHDDAIQLDIGNRIVWTRGAVTDATLTVTHIGTTWNPQEGWAWAWYGHEPWEIQPRYDPIVGFGWDRYYMADGPYAQRAPTGTTIVVWPEETAGGLDEQGMWHRGNTSELYNVSTSAVLGDRRVMQYTDDDPGDDDRATGLTALSWPATFVAVVGFDDMPGDTVDLTNRQVLAIVYGSSVTSSIHLGFATSYSANGNIVEGLQMQVARDNDLGDWVDVGPELDMPGNNQSTKQNAVMFAVEYSGTGTNLPWKIVSKENTTATGTHTLSGTLSAPDHLRGLDLFPSPLGALPHVRPALYAMYPGLMLSAPDQAWTDWEDWIISGYGLDQPSPP